MRMILIAVFTVAALSPAWAGSGIGKGGASQTTPKCNQGDTYDASRGLCVRPDGSTYKPR